MTDRELLEAAAKAAGLTIEYWAQNDYPVVRDGRTSVGWSPLIFDSDALRLAVALRIQVPVIGNGMHADPYAATRRAIVRAAAAMAPSEQ